MLLLVHQYFFYSLFDGNCSVKYLQRCSNFQRNFPNSFGFIQIPAKMEEKEVGLEWVELGGGEGGGERGWKNLTPSFY